MQRKILVVDNHPMILKFMVDLLQKEGYEVLSADDGISALKLLDTYTPDILFIDLIIPNITGEKLCGIIRSMPRLKNVYICILSAIAAEQEIDFIGVGADACIAKGPINKMSKHVLYVLRQVELGATRKPLLKTIGCEDVFIRHITKELLSTKRHFEVILSKMSQGILELSLEGTIVYANDVALSLIGMSEEKVLSTPFVSLFQEPSFAKVKEIFGDLGEHERSISEEHPLMLGNRQISLAAIPVWDQERKSVIVIMDDVGEKNRMKEQIMQAQKMKAISTLAGGIAHEFNNALQGIVGSLDLLQSSLEKSGIDAPYIEPMHTSLKRMSTLTDQLLAYAEGGKYQPRTVHLADFVKEALSSIQHSIEPRITLKTHFAEDTPHVAVDLTQLQMVLLALVTNASEAIGGEGMIEVRTGEYFLDDSSAQHHGDLKPGPFAFLTVKDNGRGMDRETCSRIFEPFFTTKFQGRGFGMSAVYGIVRNHEGWIFLDSAINKGTEVKIILPSRNPPQKKKKKKAAPAKRSNGKITILVVDDEMPVLQVTKEMMEALGYRVIETDSGSGAVETARTEKGKIDMVFLDIGLPDMDAEKAYRLLKEARPDIKVILCSGYSIEGPARKLLSTGAHGFIQKPYTLGVLSEKISEVIGSD